MDELINFPTPSNEMVKVIREALVHYKIGIKPILSNG